MTSPGQFSPSANSEMLNLFKRCIPKLTSALHKGQCGRIGVVGGSFDYSGAPYYVAMTALRLGADLSHVFCSKAIAPSIRAYSPDIIVHSTLDSQNVADTVQWFPRLHALTVGPGLGRDASVFDASLKLVREAKQLHLLLVFDADAIHLLAENRLLLLDYTNAILTPNKMEFKVLLKSLGLQESVGTEEALKKVSDSLGGCAILLKGAEDVLYSRGQVVVNNSPAGLSRCGGQGDLLSAATALFAHWAQQYSKSNPKEEKFDPLLLGAYAASVLVRETSRQTFEQMGRAMVASDMLNIVPLAFKHLFE